MANRVLPQTFGAGARNQLRRAGDRSAVGARAALETFYYALNQRDFDALAAVWSGDPLALLYNPLGGSVHGTEITDLYRRVLHGAARFEIEFGSIVEYIGPDQAVFAGRETGRYIDQSGAQTPLAIRTTRYFQYDVERGRWSMAHHHGSIDDPDALRAYQQAVLG
jgi:ketosteroid isomerase-like protein